jgi:hypothetical protein
MNPLNPTDGWEELVNGRTEQKRTARDRVAAWRRERKLKKLWLSVCLMATITITFVILGIFGAMSGWLTATVSIGTAMAGCFQLGRYMETKKV